MLELIIGEKYKWKHEPQILHYVGKKNGWHQFTLNGKVWCECLNSDLQLMEKVVDNGEYDNYEPDDIRDVIYEK